MLCARERPYEVDWRNPEERFRRRSKRMRTHFKILDSQGVFGSGGACIDESSHEELVKLVTCRRPSALPIYDMLNTAMSSRRKSDIEHFIEWKNITKEEVNQLITYNNSRSKYMKYGDADTFECNPRILKKLIEDRNLKFVKEEGDMSHMNLIVKGFSHDFGVYLVLGRMADGKEGNYCILDLHEKQLYDSVVPYKQQLKLEAFKKCLPVIDECYKFQRIVEEPKTGDILY